MNCPACGTRLPQGAANCPQCGAATPYDYSHTEIAPNDPTVVSLPDTVVQQPPPPTMYGSQPYGAALPAPYDPPLYGIAPQAPSGSSLYQSPYAPYNVAPPAPPLLSPQRAGNRIGIIVGIVLLVLILLGGGVFALFQYSSARNTAAAAASATATASAALHNFTAKGTFTIISQTITSSQQDGQNRIYSITEQEVDYGDLTGSYTSELTSTLHPDNTGNFYGSSTCTCTVEGKSGTLMWSFTGTRTANNSFQGQTFDVHGTGDLAKLHGQGEFQGQGLHGTYSTEFHFDA